MDFPVNALAEILRDGLLRIRRLGAFGDAAACQVEADHLHNLPGVIESLSVDLLRYYYEAERPAYLSQVGSEVASRYRKPWEEIAAYLAQHPK